MAAVCDTTYRPAYYSPTPSLWGHHFINHISQPQVKEKYSKEIEVLKDEVRSLLTAPGSKMVDTMNLIDTLERLGISYHFENEIEEKLQHFFNLNTDYKDETYDLYTVALHFRLFRQHGYPVSCDIFGKWRDGNGKFEESIKSDAKGLLSLYEASYLRIHGETLLDHALDFAKANLRDIVPNIVESALRKEVEFALTQSFHLCVPRVAARHFISIYEQQHHKNDTLLRFAKLDFNLLQILYKEELSEVSRWWKELDVITKLPYARDRVVECYFWAVAVYYEPKYSRARLMLAKTIAFVCMFDDTYDSYGTVEELELLTHAIQRWDINEIHGLPGYIKAFYKAQLELYQQFEGELAKEGKAYQTRYAIEALKELAVSYYVEAKWFIEGYLPPFEEYLKNGHISSGSGYLTLALLMGMESTTKQDFECLSTTPKMVVATMIINRLVGDIASFEVEKERGQIATGIESYMKEKGVTQEEAMKKFNELATNAWKDTTEEGLKPCSYSRDVYIRLLNFNRIVDVSYKNFQDGFTKPEKVLKPHITALFIDQINI